MDHQRRLRAVVAVSVALLLAVGGAAATSLPAGQALVVETADSGEELLRVPVEENTTVALEYTHSVEKTRVLDAYAVRGGPTSPSMPAQVIRSSA